MAAYEDGRRDVDRIVRRFVSQGAVHGSGGKNADAVAADEAGPDGGGGSGEGGGGGGAEMGEIQDGIPKAIAKAYLERLADELRERAEKL